MTKTGEEPKASAAKSTPTQRDLAESLKSFVPAYILEEVYAPLRNLQATVVSLEKVENDALEACLQARQEMSTLSNETSQFAHKVDMDDCLRGKTILVCRTSGIHRLPSYQRATSVGVWASPKDRDPSISLPLEQKWASLVEPVPMTEGYGAKLVFLHPDRVPWVEEVASDWIHADCSDMEASWSAVESYIASRRDQEPGFAFAGVVTFDEFALSSCALISERLGLTTSTPYEDVCAIRNKYRLRRVCEHVGVPVPRAIKLRLSDVFSGALTDILNPAADAASPAPDASPSWSSRAEVRVAEAELQLEQLRSGHPAARVHRRSQHGPAEVDDVADDAPDAEWAAYYARARARLSGHALQYPLVVKPLAGAGSNFVRRARDWGELEQVLRLFAEQCAAACPRAAAEAPAGEGECAEAALLRSKWRHWGLGALDSAFMVEECMEGQEVDLDLLVQDGRVLYCLVNDNFPTAGHAHYFMEAGGQVASSLPFSQQLGLRVMAQRILEHFGPRVNGVWHLEALVARNMPWATTARFGVMAGAGYACMPVEINQRMGGSEVSCLTASVSGLDLVAEALKVACGVPLPRYYSWSARHHRMNHMGWERMPGAPCYDPRATRPHGPQHPHQAQPTEPWSGTLAAEAPTSPALHLALPAPRALMPTPEPLPFALAQQLADAHARVFDLPEPTHEQCPGSMRRPRFACSIDFVPAHGGTLRQLELPPGVYNDPYFLGSTMWYDAKTSPTVCVPPQGFDFLGWLAAGGDSPEEAQSNMLRLASLLRWEIQQE